MAHVHHHHHHDHDAGSYYTGQLCMIGVCGALGVVALLLWSRDGLWFLAPKFRLPVLLGGVALLLLVAVRAVSVWLSVGQAPAHSHDHDHQHEHDHEHCDHGHSHEDSGHHHSHEHAHAVSATPLGAEPGTSLPVLHEHTHAHDNGHDHGWAPWRYVVLLLPITLFFLNLPNTGFSVLYGKPVNVDDLDPAEGGTAAPDGGTGNQAPINVTFLELDRAANSPELRKSREGSLVKIKGQFVPSTSDRRFTLVRYKMNCCAADAIRINVVIECAQELNVASLQGQWVEATGRVSFRKLRNREEYITVVSVPQAKEVVRVPPDLNPFLY